MIQTCGIINDIKGRP